MPLSEQEQRLLEEMERSLYQSDSDFVARVTRRQGRPTIATITVGVVAALVGVGVVVVGLVTRLPWIGILGFVVMLAGVLLALRPSVGSAARRPRRKGGASARSRRSGSFMDHMNDRWDRRENGE